MHNPLKPQCAIVKDEKAHRSSSTTAPTRHGSTRTPISEPTSTPTQAHAREPKSPKPAHRPGLQRRRTTARTRYIDMLLGLDAVSPLHNILASLSVWILLAGYIVFPATFNSLQKASYDAQADSKLKSEALQTTRNLPLLYVAAVACGIGIAGCVWLWWTHRKNYVWVINRIFLPSLLNSVAGLVSTLVNVYSAQDGRFECPPARSCSRAGFSSVEASAAWRLTFR